MQVGDTVSVSAETYDEKMRVVRGERQGRVIYIHPKRRYYMVQFKDGTRESFIFQHRTSDQMLERENRSRKY